MSGPFISVSFSGGKDSTAMLLQMLERGEHIDEIVNIDTGLELPEMYAHIEQIKRYVAKFNIPFTVLKSSHSFEYWMLEHPNHSEKWGEHLGYGWPTPNVRWCTRVLKLDVLNAHYKELRKTREVIQCVGIACDEIKRLERPNNQSSRHPLVEYGLSEKDCLEYCYSKGYDWGGLYTKFNRISCWCCPLSAISELHTIFTYYPQLWAKLQEWDNKLNSNNQWVSRPRFRRDYSIAELTKRFEREDYAKKCQTKLTDYTLIEGGEE